MCSLVVIHRNCNNYKQTKKKTHYRTHLYKTVRTNSTMTPSGFTSRGSTGGKLESMSTFMINSTVTSLSGRHSTNFLFSKNYKGGCWERLVLKVVVSNRSKVAKHRKPIWVSCTLWEAHVRVFSVRYCVPQDYFTAAVMSKQRNIKLHILPISLPKRMATKSSWWATPDGFRLI